MSQTYDKVSLYTVACFMVYLKLVVLWIIIFFIISLEWQILVKLKSYQLYSIQILEKLSQSKGAEVALVFQDLKSRFQSKYKTLFLLAM